MALDCKVLAIGIILLNKVIPKIFKFQETKETMD
jgi:hypothetical protein